MKHFILGISITILLGCFGTDPQKTGKEGKEMPAFSLLLIDSTTSLSSVNMPKGNPIVFFYFSPFCPYCIKQTKEIIEDMDKLKDIQFYFISNFPFQDVKRFNSEYSLGKYPNITVGLDTANFVADYFEAPGYPYIAIYGKERKLNKTFLGKLYSSQIKKAAEE